MPSLSKITNNFFVNLINRLGIRPPPAESFLLTNVVTPVSIVDTDVAFTSVVGIGAIGSPFTIGESAAPATNTVLADTGAQPAGVYNATLMIASDDPGFTPSFIRIQRRDAANAVNIWTQLFALHGSNPLIITLRTNLDLNERLRIIKFNNATAATVYQASIFLST